MKNAKIKIFELQQTIAMRKAKTKNTINLKQDKFFTGDFVSIHLTQPNSKGDLHTRKYIDGIVIKGNTQRSKEQFTNIEDNLDVYNMTDEQKKKYNNLKTHDYITIGHTIDTTNKLIMKVLINEPKLNIDLVRRARYKNGAMVKGSGRSNKIKQFMSKDISNSRLKEIFKNISVAPK